MFEIKKQVVNWGDTLYVVKRTIPDNGTVIDTPGYKDFLGADKVAKKNNMLFFLEEIKEVDILEEIPYIQEVKKVKKKNKKKNAK
ncbi:hypothetical protein OAA15_00455 [bacterium]|nr:hypothetical protein [bacterium]